MTINKHGSWKKFHRAVLLGALATMPMLTQAAKITVEGSTQMVLGVAGAADQAIADSKGFGYLFDKPTMVVTTELENGIRFEVALDLESIVRREINVNDSADKNSSLDGNQARGIVQEVVASLTRGAIDFKGGYGDVGFDKRPKQLALSRTSQEYNERLAERLFLRADYNLESGTRLSVAIFDGKSRSAINLADDYKWSDLLNVQDGDLSDRISGMAAVEQKLGGANVRLAYAAQQLAANDLDNKIAASVDGNVTIKGQEFNAMLQYIRHFSDSMKGMDSWMAQVSTKLNDKTTVYVRGEITDQNTVSGKDEALTGTIGLSHDVYSNKSVKVTAIGEILASNMDNNAARQTALAARLGLRISGATTIDTSKRE